MLQEALQYCPYCGEPNTLLLEPQEQPQEYVEDCTVCCQPMLVRIEGENISVERAQ